MTDFFKKKTKLQLAGDVAIGALGSARNGVFGSLLLASLAGSTMPAIGTLVAITGACAVGGALLIIPAMLTYQELFSDANYHTPFHMKMALLTENAIFKSALAFVAGCTGAMILGLAIIPTGLACLTGAFAFSLLNLMTNLIIEATGSIELKNEHYLARQVI